MNTFDETTHTYCIDGKPVPSVTQVLSEAGIVDRTWFTDAGAERGTFVHEMTALYDQGELDEDEVDPAIKPYLEAWKRFTVDTRWQSIFIEQQYFSEQYLFAGTVDRVGFRDRGRNENAVVDLKSNHAPSWLVLQLAAYQLLSAAPLAWGVTLLDTGKYRMQNFKPSELIEARKVFLAALSVCHWKRSQK